MKQLAFLLILSFLCIQTAFAQNQTNQPPITEPATNTIILYPNPANDILNIEVKKACTLKVYGLVGNKLPVFYLNGPAVKEIDIKTWEEGIYLIAIESTDSEGLPTISAVRFQISH